MTRVASGTEVTLHDLAEQWTVLVAEQDNGIANVRAVEGVGQVFVADIPRSPSTPGNCFAAASCLPGGGVRVTTRNAPPALLATRSGHRAVPDGVADHERVQLDDDDLLILLSASALEGLPTCLARVLHEPPDLLLRTDPAALLGEVFDASGSGAGVVIMRRESAPLMDGEHG